MRIRMSTEPPRYILNLFVCYVTCRCQIGRLTQVVLIHTCLLRFKCVHLLLSPCIGLTVLLKMIQIVYRRRESGNFISSFLYVRIVVIIIIIIFTICTDCTL